MEISTAQIGHAAEHLGQPGAVGGCQHGRRHHRPGGGPAGQDRADIGGSSYVGIGGGARVIGNKVDIRASNTVRGESALSAYSVKLVGADVSKHDVKIRPQSVIRGERRARAGDTIDTAGATVASQGNYGTPGMLDMVATNDIIYTQRNKITGVAGFTVTLSTNHLSTDGALAQVKINGAFVRNTWRRDALAANTRGVTTISDMLIISVASASRTGQQQRPDRAQQHPIDNSSIEGQHPGAGRQQQVSDPLSTGYLLARNVSFTMVGVAQIPLVNRRQGAPDQHHPDRRRGDEWLADQGAAQRAPETNPSMLDQAR